MSSDEETTSPNNNQNGMDVDIATNESSSSSLGQKRSNAILDIGLGSGYISGSDDEDINQPIASKSSTPDSTTLASSMARKPLATGRHPLTKTKSSLVNYERDSDDDEHTDEEEEDNEEENNDLRNGDEENSNSNSVGILHGATDGDIQIETITYTEQTIVTSDLLNCTPLKPEESSPSHRSETTPNFPLIFPEDADIRIPPEPTKRCSSELERKFEEYYKRFKRTGINQNVLIQELKDFRNPCMYEKIISHLDIDEIGTNFPQDLYDPHWWGKESYYEELSKAQKLEMDRREKERRERTKIGFVPGVKKIEQLGISTSDNIEKRKSRFD